MDTQFLYKVKSDKNNAYINGVELKSDLLLDNIEVVSKYTSTGSVRKYNFKYSTDNINSYLKEIQEESGNGEFINPTIFKYGDRSTNVNELKISQSPQFEIPKEIQIFYISYSNTVDYFFSQQSAQNFIDQSFFAGYVPIYSQILNTIYSEYNTVSGDFNGDGFTDIIKTFYCPSNPGFDKILAVYINQKNNTYAESHIGFNKDLIDLLTIKSKYQVVNFSDYNGDGIDDILGYSYIGNTPPQSSGNTQTTTTAKTVIYTFNKLGVPVATVTPAPLILYGTSIFDPNNTALNQTSYGNTFHSGDFDGDGNLDYINILSNHGGTGSNTAAYISYPSKNSFNNPFDLIGGVTSAKSSLILNSHKAVSMDFDGDGVTEIFANDLIYSVKNGQFHGMIWHAMNTADIKQIHVGDFNGDKKTEILYLSNTTNQWHILKSNGLALNTDYSFGNQLPNIEDNECSKVIRVSDFNGDGRSDILLMDITTNWRKPCSSVFFKIFYSNGNLFQLKQSNTSSFIINGYDDICYTTLIGDFNGDGKADLNLKDRGDCTRNGLSNYYGYLQQHLNKRRHIYFDEVGDELVLQKIKTGFGVKTEFKYETLSRLPDHYQDQFDNAYTYPSTGTDKYIYANSPLKVAYKMIGDQNLGDHIIEYKYKALLMDKKGRGFLGFREVKSIDHTYDRTSIAYTNSISTNINLNYPYILQPDKTETYRTSDNLLLKWSKSYIIYQPLTTTNNLSYYTEKLESYDYFSGTSTTELEYDGYGNIKKSTITSPLFYKKITDYTYGTTASQRPALPEFKIEQNLRPGLPTKTSTSKFEYTALKQLKKKTDFYGQLNTIITEYEYNINGLPTKTTLTGYGMTPRVTENIYNSSLSDLYLWKTKNALGQETVMTIDPRWNEPTSATGVDGLTSTISYDDWGRASSTSDGFSTSTTNINWMSFSIPNGNGLDPIYYSTTSSTNKPTASTYYDKLGKTFLTINQIANGNQIAKFSYYDKHGNNTINELKDNMFGFISKSQTKYDLFNRPYEQSVYESSGAAETILSTISFVKSGNNWVTTTTVPASASNANGKTSTVTKNIEGEVIETIENGVNPMTYEYDANGKNTKIKHGSLVLVENIYDDYGRVVTVKDNSAGTKTYIYNSLGEIKSENTPHGFTNIVYDAVGRKQTVNINEGSISYLYYPSLPAGPKAGKIQKISGYLAGNYEEFDYDSRGRLNKQTKGIAGRPGAAPFVTQLVYDNQNNLIQKTYPSGTVIDYTYNSLGALDEVLKGSTQLYKIMTYKPSGSIATYKLGGQLVENKYNNFQQLSGIQSAHINDVYDWDPINNNLINKEENKIGFKYHYEYDKFEQLTLEDLVSHNDQNSLVYNDNGNIEFKGSAGDYKYNLNTTKAFAVQKIENAYEFSPYKQDIEYTSFNRPFELRQHIYKLNYSYDHNYQRVKGQFVKNGITEYTRFYAGGTELDYDAAGNLKQSIEYIDAGGQLVAMNVIEPGATAPALWYVQTDYQSTIKAVYNASGQAYYQAFDAWGVPRDLNSGALNHKGKPVSLPVWLNRGYTGQEHLYEFGLINLNARLYDPHNSRMLGPDIRTYGGDLQGFNKFTYCHNNPLKYSDQNGEVIVLAAPVAAFLIGAGIGAVSYIGSLYIQEVLHPGTASFDLGQFFISAGIGGLSGMCTFGIGEALKHSVQDLGTELIRATMHATVNGLSTGAQGGDFGSSFVSTFATTMLGAGFSATLDVQGKSIDNYVFNAVMGGVTSEVSGGNFIQRAANATMVTALNQFGDGIKKLILLNKIARLHGLKAKDYTNISNFDLYPGIEIYQNNQKADGSAVTLPGFGIIVGGWYSGKNLTNVIQHEYGHYLDFMIFYNKFIDAGYNDKIASTFAYAKFYSYIGIPSLFNTITGIGGSHNLYWTEKRANYNAYLYFKENLNEDFTKSFRFLPFNYDY